MKITDHFAVEEFEKHGTVPPGSMAILAGLCRTILEPIREKFGALTVTSGYRPADENAAIGGVADSYHVYTEDRCAVDVVPSAPHTIEEVFNWIRLESGLPVDKVIMESDKKTGAPACIHIQYSRSPRMQAFTGQTHGTGGYTKVAFVKAPIDAIPV